MVNGVSRARRQRSNADFWLEMAKTHAEIHGHHFYDEEARRLDRLQAECLGMARYYEALAESSWLRRWVHGG